MRFYADLHIHSKYSRATSRNCDLEHLALWAKRKGILVVGTGDFTHPAWFAEIQDKLIAAEPGLFKLRPDIEREVDRRVPPSCARPVRFMLEVEISTIYKRGDKTRKIHHLIYAPDLETAGRLREKLDRIGNLASDGRPILGLDSRHLLEMTLESGPGAYLIPAHIWTPWFAALGSKSGFDSIEDCYGELTSHIFAVETGLSSDPPMNWRVSDLDRFTLVSNSDAHSPPMLGREACVFNTEVDYFAIRRALETREGFGGTVEFFPEEGKYHLDGHRACQVCLEPEETRRRDRRCPVCGKPLTIGVMHRVEELADRPGDYQPDAPSAFRSLVPLPEVVGEICRVGPKTKTVERQIVQLVDRLGPELDILDTVPLDEIATVAESHLVEALTRLRRGDVRRDSGYDGEYGTIRLFDPEELAGGGGARVPSLFDSLPDPSGASAAGPASEPDRRSLDSPAAETPPAIVEPCAKSSDLPTDAPEAPEEERREGDHHSTAPAPPENSSHSSFLQGLDAEQRAAASVVQGPLLIIAGPGTGKTRTLTHRLASLIGENEVAPESCLAVTFTRRAADEMRERLDHLLGRAARSIWVCTFHSLGFRMLHQEHEDAGLPAEPRIADPEECLELAGDLFAFSRRQSSKVLTAFSRLRRDLAGKAVGVQAAEAIAGRDWVVEKLEIFRQALARRGAVDFDDLLALPISILEESEARRAFWSSRFQYISIDEYQDIDPLQYQLMRLLVGPNSHLCAIGDPDQSIYRFRGANVGFFLRFQDDEPAAKVVELHRNYRSGASIVEAALQAVAPTSLVKDRRLTAMDPAKPMPVVIHKSPSARAEAEFVVHTIEQLLGGTSYFSLDSGRVESWDEADALSFDDIAVLYRTDAQAEVLLEALAEAGIPSQKRSHQRLADRDEVRELLDAVRARYDQESEAKRPVGEWLDLAVLDLKRKTDSVAVEVGSESGPDPIALAIDLLRPLAERFGHGLEEFLAEVAFGAEIDAWDPRAERVSLLTLHAAKGLEFQVVFVVGCEDDLLPLRFGDEEGDVNEERRLFFVGLTRARRRLYLSHAQKRRIRGKLSERRPSPFLRDIETRLIEHRESRPRPRSDSGDGVQLSLF